LVEASLWAAFQELSLWIEALCIHEWSLFTESLTSSATDRGETYRLLTSRPDNRRPLTWERNQIELLMLEGKSFTCPWTGKHLTPRKYAVDHIVPVAVYPTNELWNLVPSDHYFNSQRLAWVLSPCEDAGMKAYSKDLRLRVLAAVDRGMPRREVAQTFGVSASTVKRYLKLRRETGGAEARPIPGPPVRKREIPEEVLPAQVKRNPDLTLDEHRELLEDERGLGVSTATVSRALKGLGLPLKKRP
jgi:transposase